METNGYAPLSNKNEDTIALLSEEPVINSGSEETTTPSETKLPYSDIQKEPPPYDAPYYSASTSKEVIPQLEPVGTTNNQSLAVNTVVVQQQPHFDTLPTISPVSEAVADQTFGLSIFCCFFCCLCGSPLTLLCFIPAIVLSLNLKTLSASGDYTKARKILLATRVIIICGIIAGVILPIVGIILRVAT